MMCVYFWVVSVQFRREKNEKKVVLTIKELRV